MGCGAGIVEVGFEDGGVRPQKFQVLPPDLGDGSRR